MDLFNRHLNLGDEPGVPIMEDDLLELDEVTMSIMESWTFEMDEQLVKYMNMLGDKFGQSPLEVPYKSFHLPRPSDAPLLQGVQIGVLRLRVALLKVMTQLGFLFYFFFMM